MAVRLSALRTRRTLLLRNIISLLLVLISLRVQTPWNQSSSELYQSSDSRLSAKFVPTFAGRGCHIVSVTDPYGRHLGFLDRISVRG
jgi:hypothetical protein